MNKNNKYILKQLVDKDFKSPVKIPTKFDSTTTFNKEQKLMTLSFINHISKICNYSSMWQKVYKEAGVVVNLKTGEYFFKVNVADNLDVIIGCYSKGIYYESLTPGGISHEKYFTSNELLHYLHQFGVVTNTRNVDHKLKKHVDDGLMARHKYEDLDTSTQDYIRSGLSNNRLPIYVYSMGQKSLDIDVMVRDNEDCVLTLTKICDKSDYLKIMIDAINTLPDDERHKVIEQIQP